ncbi:membrane-fusion protein [Parvularcula bermudensis HTCC2503]|uniref:Membrane-fusion protein n=1 Tax=Parvularcula bermudensis (strain ATCC BAA-594 / HTCC2503 / KCTC 12087) TaxID=314260 RepID=E0TD41_PARBH|nr:efflux RND transporter periplasmic adaptor subunit [Parvularcula bermudensis]ADM08700.1 membrane-fusion protein [Parvularcula bermudensis HTCC2503]
MNQEVLTAESKNPGAPIRWRIFLIGVAVLAVGYLSVSVVPALLGRDETAGETPPPPLVEVVRAEAEDRTFTVTEEGFLQPAMEVDLVAEVSGKIVYVSEKLAVGGRFAEGEVLLRIQDEIYAAEVERAEANLASARANAAQATAELTRQKELSSIGASAQAQLEQVRASALSAEAAVSQARAGLRVARENLADTELRAPFDAVVSREQVSIGQYVSPQTVLAQLISSGEAEILVGISPDDAAAVARAYTHSGGRLEARVQPAQGSALQDRLTGRVLEVGTSIDPQTRTVDVVVMVPDAFSAARQGQVFARDFVAVALPARSPDPLYSAPSAALRRQSYIWRINDDQRLHRVAVRPVSIAADRVIFASDENLGGVPVLTTALTEEAEGMEVRIKNEAPQGGDPTAWLNQRPTGEAYRVAEIVPSERGVRMGPGEAVRP